MISDGFGPPLVISAARLPVGFGDAHAVGMRRRDRARDPAAHAERFHHAGDGRRRAHHAQVPTTAPALVRHLDILGRMRPPRNSPHNLRQSVQAPSTSPLKRPDQHRADRQHDRGLSALDRAITCAGVVLSQPAISTTESTGSARIISSVSIAIRLRRNIEVGYAKLSWIEMVGKHHRHRAREHGAALHRLGSKPATLPWQGLKSE
jgi:hypothetical protein